MARSGGGSPGTMANINLKGKKSKTLSCGCCEAVNLKHKCLDKIHEEEIKYYTGLSYNGSTTGSEPVDRGSIPCSPANTDDTCDNNVLKIDICIKLRDFIYFEYKIKRTSENTKIDSNDWKSL